MTVYPLKDKYDALPMNEAYRLTVYLEQRDGGALTDTQRRRLTKKAKGYAAKVARRGVKTKEKN